MARSLPHRAQVDLHFLLPPEEVTFKSRCKGHPVTGNAHLKAPHLLKSHIWFEYVITHRNKEKTQFTLSTTLCHS